MESFNHRQRLALVDRTLGSRSVDTGDTLTSFHHRILNGSVGLRSIHLLVSQGVFAIGLAAVLWVMNWPLALGLLAVASIAAVPMRMVNRLVRITAARQVSTFSTLMARLGNVFRNLSLIRAYNLQDRERIQFERHLRAYFGDIDRWLHAEGVMNALGAVLVLAGIVVIAVAQTTRFALDTALVVPFLYLFVRFAQQMGGFAGSLGRLTHTLPDLCFTFESWTKSGERGWTQTPAAAEALEPAETPFGWEIRDVTFGYAGQAPLFAGLNFQVVPGSLVHVSGPSGSGKTSLVALLMGEAVPASGTIELTAGGRWSPIGTSRSHLCAHLGYASAESYLFAGTLLRQCDLRAGVASRRGFPVANDDPCRVRVHRGFQRSVRASHRRARSGNVDRPAAAAVAAARAPAASSCVDPRRSAVERRRRDRSANRRQPPDAASAVHDYLGVTSSACERRRRDPRASGRGRGVCLKLRTGERLPPCGSEPHPAANEGPFW